MPADPINIKPAGKPDKKKVKSEKPPLLYGSESAFDLDEFKNAMKGSGERIPPCQLSALAPAPAPAPAPTPALVMRSSALEPGRLPYCADVLSVCRTLQNRKLGAHLWVQWL